MSKAEQIERDVQALTAEELAVFRKWYEEFDSDAWDRQIEADQKSGTLTSLIAEARDAYDSGKAREA